MYHCLRKLDNNKIDLSALTDKWGKKFEVEPTIIESVKLLNNLSEEKDVFMTNESVKLIISLSNPIDSDKRYLLWVGLYRDDGVYCQGVACALNINKKFGIVFPKLPLLPGGYRISLGIWDILEQKFIICHHAVYSFRMIFNRQDHGTVYLEHEWGWRFK